MTNKTVTPHTRDACTQQVCEHVETLINEAAAKHAGNVRALFYVNRARNEYNRFRLAAAASLLYTAEHC